METTLMILTILVITLIGDKIINYLRIKNLKKWIKELEDQKDHLEKLYLKTREQREYWNKNYFKPHKT
jgi:hypothetical protein